MPRTLDLPVQHAEIPPENYRTQTGLLLHRIPAAIGEESVWSKRMRKVCGLSLGSAFIPGAAQSASAQEVFTGPRVGATVGRDQVRCDLGDADTALRAQSSDLTYGFAVG